MRDSVTRTRLASLAILGSALAATTAGCSSDKADEPNLGRLSQRIEDGEVDTTSRFSVGICNGAPGSCVRYCSGALILPNVVVTARHCVSESPEFVDCTATRFGGRFAGPFNVTTNDSMGPAATGWYEVKQIDLPADDLLCGNDIALLILSTSVPDTDARPITPGIQYLMWDPAHYDPSSFIAIGHGATNTSLEGLGTRRIKRNIPTFCIPGFEQLPCPSTVSEREFLGGNGTCQGDSGGSAFESAKFGTETVSYGVLSRGGAVSAQKCEESVYTRLDAHRDFVLATARAASNEWTLYPEPAWTSEQPKPQPGDGPTTKKDIGGSCTNDDECLTVTCVDPGDGAKICSATCANADVCPSGFTCRALASGGNPMCLPPAKPPAATDDGCQASPRRPPALELGLGLLAGALVLRRRRKG